MILWHRRNRTDGEKTIFDIKHSLDGRNSFKFGTGNGFCVRQKNFSIVCELGKLYLCGRDVSRDREKAVEYLTASAEQGNLYASFLLEHLDAYQDPSLFLAATRLLHHLEKLFCEEVQRPMEMKRYQIDRKRRRKLSEKKQAQGHHRDDQEPAQGIY